MIQSNFIECEPKACNHWEMGLVRAKKMRNLSFKKRLKALRLLTSQLSARQPAHFSWMSSIVWALPLPQKYFGPVFFIPQNLQNTSLNMSILWEENGPKLSSSENQAFIVVPAGPATDYYDDCDVCEIQFQFMRHVPITIWFCLFLLRSHHRAAHDTLLQVMIHHV